MLKEENELRDTYRSFVPNFQRAALANKITALVRAVRLQEREECARVAEDFYVLLGKPFGDEIAITIRSRKGRENENK